MGTKPITFDHDYEAGAYNVCRRCGVEFKDHGRAGFATEPTEQGNQYVMPGCEKDRSRGPAQGDLF